MSRGRGAEGQWGPPAAWGPDPSVSASSISTVTSLLSSSPRPRRPPTAQREGQSEGARLSVMWAQAAGCGQGTRRGGGAGRPPQPGSPHNPLLVLHRLLVIFKISFSESGEENLFLWPFSPFFFCERLGEGCGGRREPGRAGGTSGSAPAWGPGPLLTAPPPPRWPPETRGGTPPWAARSQLLPSPSGRVVGADFTLEHSRVVALGVHPHGVQGLWGERANRDPPPGWEAGGGAGTAWIRAGWTAGRVLEARTARMGRAR